MVITDTIKLSEIEDYLKYHELRRDLILNLSRVKELAERKLKVLQTTNNVAIQMKRLKQKLKIKETNADVHKEILKHIGY